MASIARGADPTRREVARAAATAPVGRPSGRPVRSSSGRSLAVALVLVLLVAAGACGSTVGRDDVADELAGDAPAAAPGVRVEPSPEQPSPDDGGGSGGDPAEPAATYADAVERTLEEAGGRFELAQEASGQGVTVESAIAGRFTATDLEGESSGAAVLLPQSSEDPPAGVRVVDLASVYVQDGEQWVVIDRDEGGAELARSLHPLALLSDLFVHDLEADGAGEVRGVATERFAGEALIRDGYGFELEGAVVVHLDGEGRVVRVLLEAEASEDTGGMASVLQVDCFDFGEVDAVAAPPAEDTQTVDEWFGDGGGVVPPDDLGPGPPDAGEQYY